MPHDQPATPTDASRQTMAGMAGMAGKVRGLFILPAVPRVLVVGARDAERERAWPLARHVPVAYADRAASARGLPAFGWLDRRWRRYWGWGGGALAAVREGAEGASADFAAGVGLEMLPALWAVPRPMRRIWMALDEPALYQRSLAASATTWTAR